ncbi:uncharacterized protein (DUF305 family) [Actinomadura pelletieri DSM 43383]|uniref:Uncharacterized protein (DUF305 family) n=2 Tax=Actinomadura pelletieri TaxID=111805 RepID=A0A495QUC9_9ACTN|nr:uncharacterized protein (DUF305 family) [Actinomadura pelletieri DSM 43383]
MTERDELPPMKRHATERPAAVPPAAGPRTTDLPATDRHTAVSPAAAPPVTDGDPSERPAAMRGVVKYGAVALLIACVALVFAQCGAAGGSPSGGPAPASRGGDGFNSQDVMFLQMMLPHQEQGVKLVRLAKEHPVSPQVRTLALAIESTQIAEAEQMQRRLREWRRPLRAQTHEHAAHGGMPQTTDAELAVLVRNPPDRFERAFLNLLIGHQDDALQMARLETGKGEDAWTRNLAARVDRSRSAQIDQMLAILGPPSSEGSRPPEDSHRK